MSTLIPYQGHPFLTGLPNIIDRAWFYYLQLIGQNAVQPGSIVSWSGTAANVPSGYLFTNGATVSRVTYANLNALAAQAGYGAPWGAGDGFSSFAIPTVANSMIKT